MYSVYRLIDPRDMQVRYVGISKNVQQRFYQHMAYKGNNKDKDAWIQELKENSFIPIINVIATNLTFKEAQEEENRLIYHYQKLGFPLTNWDGIRRKPRIAREKAKSEPRTETRFIFTKPQLPRLLELEEVADKLRVARSTVLRYINLHQLEAVRVGGRYRVRQEALDRYIRKNTTTEEGKK